MLECVFQLINYLLLSFRSDCLHLLADCVDYNRLSADVSVESLCSSLSAPADDKNCISLKTYLGTQELFLMITLLRCMVFISSSLFCITDKPRQLLSRSEFVSLPCKPNPCNSTHVCIINQRKCRHPKTCKKYTCKPGQLFAVNNKYIL